MVVNSGTIPTLKTDHWPASLRSPKFGQGVEAGPGIAISFKYPAIFVADGLLDPGDLAAGPAVGFRRGGEAGSCGFLRPVLDDRLRHGHDLGDWLRSLNAEHPLLLDRLRARRGPPLLGLAMHGGSRAIAGSSRDYLQPCSGSPVHQGVSSGFRWRPGLTGCETGVTRFTCRPAMLQAPHLDLS